MVEAVTWYREVPGKRVYHLVREPTTWDVWCRAALPRDTRVTMRPAPGRRLCQRCYAGFAIHGPYAPGVWATAPEEEAAP